MSVKGLEMPAYDPRGMQGQGLLYATSNRGACHMRGNMLGLEVLGLPKLIDRFQVQGKSSYVILHQNTAAAIDSLVVCKFTNMGVAEEYFARTLDSRDRRPVRHRRPDPGRRAGLEPGAPVQPARRLHPPGRHPAAAPARRAGAELARARAG